MQTYGNGKTTISIYERKASIRQFYCKFKVVNMNVYLSSYIVPTMGWFWNQFCAFDNNNQHILNMFFLFFSGYISCSIATSNGHHRFG